MPWTTPSGKSFAVFNPQLTDGTSLKEEIARLRAENTGLNAQRNRMLASAYEQAFIQDEYVETVQNLLSIAILTIRMAGANKEQIIRVIVEFANSVLQHCE